MKPLPFTDDQVAALRSAAAMVPPDARSELLRLIVSFIEFEGDTASAATFDRALNFARDYLICARRDCC
jgi:hypothetical protein